MGGLVIYDWYDLICFGIIGVALLAALIVLWIKEGILIGIGIQECDVNKAAAITYDRQQQQQVVLLVDVEEDNKQQQEEEEEEPPPPLLGMRGKGRYCYHEGLFLWSSCWRGLHPAWLLFIRFFSFLTLCACLSWDLFTWDASIFFYYTEWTCILVIIYFGIGTIISAHGCVVYYLNRAPPASHHFLKLHLQTNPTQTTNHLQNQQQQQPPPAFLGYLMQTSYQTCAGAVILTDTIFWCVIVPFLSNAHLQVNWLMGSMHTLNAVFLLVDASVNSLPFPWFRLAYFVIWSCSYVIFQLVIHACGYTWWPYPFLELSTPLAPFWYFCMAVIHIPCYGIYWLFIKAKNTIFSRLFPDVYVAH